MVFNKNTDFIFFAGLLILTVLTLPLVSTENIDCNGKAFHCVNSTHFKICVDFGGGVSKTVDEFLIPCPTNTVCRDVNKFECENQAATTLSAVRQINVTNEQSETIVTPIWEKVEITTLLTENKTKKEIEKLKNDLNSSAIVTDFSSSVYTDDPIDNIITTTTITTTATLDGQLNKVELNSENEVQLNDQNNLSDSATVSYDSASSYVLHTSYDELSTTTEKVNGILLSFTTYGNTSNDLLDTPPVTPSQPFETITENIRNTGEIQTYEIFTNNDANGTKNKTAIKIDNSLLISQNKSMSTPPEVFENSNIYSTKAINVTDFSTTLIATEIVNIELKEENVANSSINMVNAVTTAASYNVDNKQFNQSNDVTLLTLPYNYKNIGKITENANTPTSTQTETLTTVIYRDFNTSKTFQDNILARNEALLTSSYPSTEISPTTLVSKSKNISIDSSVKNNGEKLSTLINYNQNYEENGDNSIYINDLNTENQHQTNVSADVLAQNDKTYEINLSVTNTIDTLAGLLPTIFLSSTTTPSNLLGSNTFSDNVSSVFTDLNKSESVFLHNITIPFKVSEAPVTSKISNVTLFERFNHSRDKQNIPSLKITNETQFTEELFEGGQLLSHLYDISTENNLQKINNTAGFVKNGYTTSPTKVYRTMIPTKLNPGLEYDTSVALAIQRTKSIETGVQLTTTLKYKTYPENYKSVTANWEIDQNQKSEHAYNSTQSFISAKDKNGVPTTVTSTIYSPQDVDILKDTLLNKNNITTKGITNTNNEPFLASTVKISIDSYKTQGPNNLNHINTHISNTSINNENVLMNYINESANLLFNQRIVYNTSHITPIKKALILNTTSDNSFNNDNFFTQTISPILYHENEPMVDIKQNNTTTAANDNINANLLSTNLGRSTETYSVTQNVLDTSIDLENYDVPSTTKSYSVNVNSEYVTNGEKITKCKNNENETPLETSTQPTVKIKSSVYDTNSGNYYKKNNAFEQKLRPSNSNIFTNYNSTLRPIYNVTNKNNAKLNLLVKKNTTQKEPSKNYFNEQITLLSENFTCLNRDRGKYSDSSDCKKFYICIGKLDPIFGMCPEDTVFSEVNKQCTKNLSHCVRNNQFKCLSSGRFIDVLSEGYFYICIKKVDGYLRLKLQCQKGYHLNKENITCASKVTSFENISKTISDNSSNEYKSKEIVHLKKYEVKFDCKKEGKFEHPHDCRKYFVCTKGSKAEFRRKIKNCDSDEVFNKDKRKCVDSDSYEC